MKSDLQIRAERAAQRFSDTARKPIVIEFAGLPKAGKTTTLGQLQSFLRRCKFKVEVVVERASICPIRDKKHSNFNVWTASTTLAQILEKTQEPPRNGDPHILILDRGLFDSSWLAMMERMGRIRSADRETIENFLLIDDWRERVTGVIVMTASPTDALARENPYLPVEGEEGSIMTLPMLERIVDNIHDTTERLKSQFRIYTIDTSSGDTKDDPRRTAEKVVDIVLSLVEEQLQEDILCLPKTAVTDLFQGNVVLQARNASSLKELFLKSGEFHPRQEVEKDGNLVQALPVVIVRKQSGDVLRLRRREKSEHKILHDKIVIWAGGHVRNEDAKDGDSIIECALRELQEELRLSLEAKDLRLIGAVYADVEKESTSKHVALVYEWRAQTDDVTVALSSAEFSERRGTSLSGSFVSLETLAADVNEKRMSSEVWSEEIVRNILAKDTFEFKPRLFK